MKRINKAFDSNYYPTPLAITTLTPLTPDDMDGMKNGDGKQIVMLLYGVDGFSDEEPFIFV